MRRFILLHRLLSYELIIVVPLYLSQNTTARAARTIADAAQIHTRFGSLNAGVRISPNADERAVVKRNNDVGQVLGNATSCGLAL